MRVSTDSIIKKLKLKPHPEGGYYRQVYKSDGYIPPETIYGHFQGKRAYSTAIYYLLQSDEFSAFHKIKQDEIWHYYSGSALDIHVLSQNGEHRIKTVGDELKDDGRYQQIVHAGNWFAAEVKSRDTYALVGCTVAPGFEFDDLEIADRHKLLQQYPQQKNIIKRFTR